MTNDNEMFRREYLPFATREMFLGYKYRKANNKLYCDPDIPKKLISF